jgi:hypothetical protein
MADFVEGVELRDSVPHFVEHYSGCPALLVDQQVTEYVQSFRPGEMAQARGIEHQD